MSPASSISLPPDDRLFRVPLLKLLRFGVSEVMHWGQVDLQYVLNFLDMLSDCSYIPLQVYLFSQEFLYVVVYVGFSSALENFFYYCKGTQKTKKCPFWIPFGRLSFFFFDQGPLLPLPEKKRVLREQRAHDKNFCRSKKFQEKMVFEQLWVFSEFLLCKTVFWVLKVI